MILPILKRLNKMESILKRSLEPEDKVLEVVQELWLQCKKENVEPTQILFGKRAFALALKDEALNSIISIDEQRKTNKDGVIGFIGQFELVTDFYNDGETLIDESGDPINELGWSIEENTVAFNLGAKLQGII